MRDEKYQEVKKFVEEDIFTPNVASLRKKFGIGHNRATDYIDYLVRDGVLVRVFTDKWNLRKVN